MDAMNLQESIIALLQGDLTDKGAVNDLLQALAKSQEGQAAVVRHISLMRKFHVMGSSISPSPAADASLLAQITQIENNEMSPSAAPPEANSAEWLRKSFSSRSFVVGILLSLIAGMGVGWALRPAYKSFLGTGVSGSSAIVMDSSSISHRIVDKQIVDDNAAVHSQIPERNQADSLSKNFNVRNGVRDKEERKGSGNRENNVRPAPQVKKSGGLNVLFPNGGERFKKGSMLNIKWQGVADTTPIVVQVSPDNGKTWSLIAKGILTPPLHWRAPNNSPDQGGYLVKVSEENAAGVLPLLMQQVRHDTVLNIPTLSKDGTLLFLPDYGGRITVWDTQTWRLIQKLEGHSKSILHVTVSPDNSTIASTSLDGTVRVWDWQTGRQLHQIAGKGKVLQISWVVVFSSTGDTLAIGNDDGTVTFLDTRSGKELLTFQPFDEAIRSLSYSADGKQLLITSTNKGSGIFDAQTGLLIRRFADHELIANSMTMSQDGTLAITGSFDGTVRFWDVATGRLIRSIQYFGGDKIGRVILSPDGQFLAVGGFGRDVLLVDPSTGAVLATLPLAVADGRIGAWPIFSPDSHSLIVTHESDILKWRLDINRDVSDDVWSIH